MLPDPSDVIHDVSGPLLGLPVFLAGSAVAAEQYLNPQGFSDVDFFCRTPETIMAAAQKLIGAGFVLDDRNESIHHRWMRYGMKGWHTNSLKLHSPADIEVNLVFKTIGKKPVQSLAEVLESFDFGLLAIGYDLEDGLIFRDMRSFMFPDLPDNAEAFPLMPNKRIAWRRGQFSRYNGTREPWRYSKYASRGFDMSLVKEDLLLGYEEAIEYWTDRGDPEHLQLAEIYTRLHADITANNYKSMLDAGLEIIKADSLDAIMDALNRTD